jgi:hypothetical protein
VQIAVLTVLTFLLLDSTSERACRGFNKLTIMLGGGAQYLQEYIASRQAALAKAGTPSSLRINEVVTTDFASTGHGWTWYQARPSWEAEGKRPVLLLHADIVYDAGILDGLLAARAPTAVALLNPFQKKTGDEIVALGAAGVATGMRPLKQLNEVRPGVFTGKDGAEGIAQGEIAGMNKLSAPFMQKLFEFMQGFWERKGKNANW